MLAPSEDEVGYELTDWSVTDRGPVTAALIEAGIPYRWEPGLVLVVPEAAEEQVDGLMDELETEAVEAEAGEEADAGADGGEEAQAAMSDLFVASDRLKDAPSDDGVRDELREASSAVGACLPPYGIERRVWRKIQEQASAVVTGFDDGADDEAVAADARALRDVLREFV